jgi:hypothetical protein
MVVGIEISTLPGDCISPLCRVIVSLFAKYRSLLGQVGFDGEWAFSEGVILAKI